MLRLFIYFLAFVAPAQALADDWRPTPEAVRDVCEQLTDPLQRSILLDRRGLFRPLGDEQRDVPQSAESDINNDGAVDDVIRTRNGLGPWIESGRVSDGRHWTWPTWHESPVGRSHDDLSDKLKRAGEVNVLEIGQHRYLLVSNDRAETDPMLLAIIGPDWSGRLLCRFEPRVTLAVARHSALSYRPYCLAIADRRHLPALELSPVAEDDPVRTEFAGHRPGWPEFVGEIVVDIFNSGEPVRLVKLRYTGNRRADCPAEQFKLVPDPSTPQKQANRYSSVLASAQRAMRPPGYVCPNDARKSDLGRVDLLEWRGDVLIHMIPARPYVDESIQRFHRRDDGNIRSHRFCSFTRVQNATVSELDLDWLRQ